MHKLRRNSLLTLVTPLIPIVVVVMAVAAHAQMSAAVSPPQPLSSRYTVGSTGPSTPLFSPPLTYNDAGDTLNTLVVADLNGDHKPDVVVMNSTGIAVLLGNGDGTFQSPAMYSVGGSAAAWWPAGLAVADLRKNGILDVVVASGAAIDGNDPVSVLLGNGDGTFQPAVTYSSGNSGGGIYNLVLADLNRDGKKDIILFNPNSGSARTGSITVLLGKGDGTFQPGKVILENTGQYGWDGIALADVNGDGKLDLIIAEPYAACVAVFLGNGNGTFQSPVTYAATAGLYLAALAVADVNGDGKPDILDGNLSGDGIGVLLGNGDGTFQPMQTFGSGNISSIAVADVNGDGKKDLILTPGGAGGPIRGGVRVMLGKGDGTFQDEVSYDTGTNEANSVAIADLNGDGRKDAVAVDLCARDPLGNCVPPGDVSVLLHAYATTTTLDPSPLDPSVYGQTVTFTAHVTSSHGTATGTVTLFDGSNAVASGSLVNGSVAIPVSTLAVGSYSITAKYEGAPGFAPSTSAPANQTVNVAPSTTSLASSMNPVPVKEWITITATVTSQYGGALTGQLDLYLDGTYIATSGLNSSQQAAFTWNSTATGSHGFTATYSGDPNNAGGTSATFSEQVIAGVVSKTVVATSGSPTYVGQSVTFTATVSSKQGPIPNGEIVTFSDGATNLAWSALAGGTATYQTSSLSAKTYYIKAYYPGDATFQPSTGIVKQVVLKYPTTTSLSSSLNPSQYGQPVTFTAMVTQFGPYAFGGQLRFFDGTRAIGTVALRSGVATLTSSRLAVGTHAITAKYSGDSYNAQSTSTIVNQVVQ